MGVKPNGDRVNSATYFCETFADILNAKKISCSKEKTDRYYGHFNAAWSDASKEKYSLDTACKKYATTVGAEIITIDDVVFYSVNPFLHFNASFSDAYDGAVAEPETRMYYQVIDVIESNAQGLLENSYEVYKSFCMDVDGINKGEDPFGYGIRVDGKILNGTRATEWLNKSIQGDD